MGLVSLPILDFGQKRLLFLEKKKKKLVFGTKSAFAVIGNVINCSVKVLCLFIAYLLVKYLVLS